MMQRFALPGGRPLMIFSVKDDRRAVKDAATDRMNTPQEITPRYLRIPQAASYLGLAPKTLYRLAEEKRIPHIRNGRTLFFDRLALDKWMQTGTVSPLPVWEN